jgi:hypothetical protein
MPCTFATQTAHQRLVRHHGPRLEIDDRLEGHREIRDGLLASTSLAPGRPIHHRLHAIIDMMTILRATQKSGRLKTKTSS